VVPIEIQLLIDRFEALLVESRQVPFTPSVLINRDRCFDIINQMRVSIPEEIRKAKRQQQEGHRIVAQANEEAERVLALARKQAVELITGSEVVEQAQNRVEIVLERSRHEARQVKAGADEYAFSVLRQLEERLLEHLTTVRNGMVTLESNSQDAELSAE